MTLSHWFTDILASVFMGWILMHLLYFYILRVPDQRRFMAAQKTLPQMPEAWEIILCIYIFIATIGTVMTVIGSRSLFVQAPIWLALLIPLGMGCVWLSWKRSSALRSKVLATLDLG
jgi:hypothetical protein